MEKGRQYFKVPELKFSGYGVIMVGFHRVPKTEEDKERFKKSRSDVPDNNYSTDTVLKRVANKVTTKVMSEMKYMHCEVAFKKSMFYNTTDAPSTVVAYGVFRTDKDGKRGKVWCKERTFMSPYYDWIFLKVPLDKAYKVAEFHQNQIGKPFNSKGVVGVYTLPSETDGKSWYCVPLHMCGLEYGGVVKGYAKDATRMTVDEFYNILKRNEYRTLVEMTPLERYKKSKEDQIRLITYTKPLISSSANDLGYVKRRSGDASKSKGRRRKKNVVVYTGFREYESAIEGIPTPNRSKRKPQKSQRRKAKIASSCDFPES